MKDWRKQFDEKFSVFDGSQKIIKHVTYSRWVKHFFASAIEEERNEERNKVIEEVDRLIETHIRHSFSVAKILNGNTLDELDFIRQQLNQLKGTNDKK